MTRHLTGVKFLVAHTHTSISNHSGQDHWGVCFDIFQEHITNEFGGYDFDLLRVSLRLLFFFSYFFSPTVHPGGSYLDGGL